MQLLLYRPSDVEAFGPRVGGIRLPRGKEAPLKNEAVVDMGEVERLESRYSGYPLGLMDLVGWGALVHLFQLCSMVLQQW